MNRKEEQALRASARKAADLRQTIDSADSMLRSWARHKKEEGDISLFLADRRYSPWRCNINLPAQEVQAKLVPVLKEIRREAKEQLAALTLPGDQS